MDNALLIEEILGLEEILPVQKFSYSELKLWNTATLWEHLADLERKIG